MGDFKSKYTGQQIETVLDHAANITKFDVKDIYPTLADLQAAFPAGNEYAYQVVADQNVYIWSAINGAWESLGQLKGEKGADGKTAYQSAIDGGYTGTESEFNTILATAQTQITKNADDIATANTNMGDLATLTTTEKSSAVGAINEVNASLTAQNRGINLLDNADFTYLGFIINSRGVSSYSADGYGIDRWYSAKVTIALSSGYLTITPADTISTRYFAQRVEKDLFGFGIHTFSVLDSSGNVYTLTGEFPSTGSIVQTHPKFNLRMGKAVTGSYVQIEAMTEAINIKRIKLEKGAISTILNDTSQNYGAELAKCQRYRELISTSSCVGISNGVGGIYVRHGLPYKVTKRISNPTVVIRSYNNTTGKISYYSSGSWLDADATVVADSNGFFLEATLPVANANTAWGAWAEINAEL